MGVDDDLAPGEARVAGGTAGDERTARVDQDAAIVRAPLDGDHHVDDFARDDVVQRARGDIGRVLRRQHDRDDLDRAAVLVPEADLRLRVGAQPVDVARTPQLRMSPHQAMRGLDRRRHGLRRLVAGVTEHEALVAGAERAVGAIDAARDLCRLMAEAHLHVAEIRVDAGRTVAVAGIAQHVGDEADDARAHVAEDLHVARAELAGDDHLIAGEHRLARDARTRILGEERVEDAVRDPIGQLVRMALGNRLGGEDAIACACGTRRAGRTTRSRLVHDSLHGCTRCGASRRRSFRSPGRGPARIDRAAWPGQTTLPLLGRLAARRAHCARAGLS